MLLVYLERFRAAMTARYGADVRLARLRFGSNEAAIDEKMRQVIQRRQGNFAQRDAGARKTLQRRLIRRCDRRIHLLEYIVLRNRQDEPIGRHRPDCVVRGAQHRVHSRTSLNVCRERPDGVVAR